MWASLLSDEDDALGLGSQFLRFGKLLEFEIDVGFDEDQWRRQEPPKPKVNELTLFDS